MYQNLCIWGYFSAYETDTDEPFDKDIPFSYVMDLMGNNCHSNRKIAILDCCYSRRARIVGARVEMTRRRTENKVGENCHK